jgi:hypothetical protein
MPMAQKLSYCAILSVLALSVVGCASLQGLRAFVQAPRFEQDTQQRSEIRLTGGGGGVPSGATVRIWTRVSNPNAFGLTLGTLRGTLYLEGGQAATADFPLGLPLRAGGEDVVPLDISVNFRDLPGLGQAISRAIARQPIEYELEGTIGVSAGALGEPVFGPMTLLRGELR